MAREKASTIKVDQHYQHFKGGEYVVRGIGKHSETLEAIVIYEGWENDEANGKIWARPLSMWDEWINKPELNYSGPRFKLIK